MLALYEGQIDMNLLKYEMPYKEQLLLRDIRVERLKNEEKRQQDERQRIEASQRAKEARDSIVIARR